MLRWLVLLAVLVYGLSLAGMAIAPVTVSPQSSESLPNRKTELPTAAAAPAPPPAPAKLSTPILGFALNLHHTDRIDLYLHAIDEIAAMGFNTVEVLTPAFQDNGASEDIHVIVGPGNSPTRDQLIEVLRHAHKRGLTTVLMPLVLFENPRGNEWRGKIQPENWDRWWVGYRKNIDYFLTIANDSGVDVFSVGSELLSTEKQIDRWRPLIVHVRDRFKGRLIYSTNWDHYQVPTFWDRLDMIGISCYWDMTTTASKDPPTPAELARRWSAIRAEVMGFAAVRGKPVLLTEIGYPSLPWGLKDPWNYVNTKDAAAAPQVQARGYSAFLDAWGDLLSRAPNPARFAGVCFFEWDVYEQGGPQDTGYGIRGKPSYDLLTRWLQSKR